MNVRGTKSAGTTPSESHGAADPFRDLRWVSVGLGIFTAASMVLTWWYGYMLVGWRFQPQTLWAIAIWSGGVGLGFLFGIPRVLQGRPPANVVTQSSTSQPSTSATATNSGAAQPASVYEQRVNTNLEEISDWLTKIIVGMALVQLNQIPGLIWRLSSLVVADLPRPADVNAPSPHLGYGTALIVAFFVLGFLFGYLVTRLYLQGALARAERGLSEEGRLELERRAVTAETSAELLSSVATSAPAAVQGAIAPSQPVLAKLQGLSNEYTSINIADWSKRTAEKNRVAAALFQTIVTEGVSRDWLANQNDEGFILGLASTAHALPEPGDAQRLLKVAPKAKRKHVRYRVATAFGRLLERGLVPSALKANIRAELETYLTDADPPLADVVKAVLNQLGAG